MMTRKSYLYFIMIAIIAIFLVGCSNIQEEKSIELVDLENGNDSFTNDSKYLTNEQAKAVYQDIVLLLQSTYPEETNQLKNAFVHFTDQKIDQNIVSVDAIVGVDSTSLIEADHAPLIVGMKRALLEVDDEKLKSAGTQYIDGHLKEMEPYYNSTNRLEFPLRLTFDQDNKGEFKYELFYLLTISGQNTLHPAQAYFDQHFKENAEEKEQLGYEMMKEELDSLAVVVL